MANKEDPAKLAEELIQQIERIGERFSEEELNRKPDNESWSACETLDHINATNRRYLRRMRYALIKKKGDTSKKHPGHSILGKLMLNFLKKDKAKVSAPNIFLPVNKSYTFDTRDFKESMKELVSEYHKTCKRGMLHIKIASPVSSLIRFNLYDVTYIIIEHTRRHIRQIERTLEAVGD